MQELITMLYKIYFGFFQRHFCFLSGYWLVLQRYIVPQFLLNAFSSYSEQMRIIPQLTRCYMTGLRLFLNKCISYHAHFCSIDLATQTFLLFSGHASYVLAAFLQPRYCPSFFHLPLAAASHSSFKLNIISSRILPWPPFPLLLTFPPVFFIAPD